MRTGAIHFQGSLFLIHVHVLSEDSREVTELRQFRDHLRAHPKLVEAYVARKRAIIASGITNTGIYAGEKGDFVEDVLQKMPCHTDG